MSTITLNRFSPFATWSLTAPQITQEPEQVPVDDSFRREHLTKLLSADFCGCGCEIGAGVLMAIFPRDF